MKLINLWGTGWIDPEKVLSVQVQVNHARTEFVVVVRLESANEGGRFFSKEFGDFEAASGACDDVAEAINQGRI